MRQNEPESSAMPAVADSLKMTEERFSEVNKNDNVGIVNSVIPKNGQKVIQFKMSIINVE